MKIYFSSDKNFNSDNSKNNKIKNLNLLKDSIDSLMSQIKPNHNTKLTIGLILKQLGCSDDEIGKLLESKWILKFYELVICLNSVMIYIIIYNFCI